MLPVVSKICRLVPACLIEPSSPVPNFAATLSGRLILPENVDTPTIDAAAPTILVNSTDGEPVRPAAVPEVF